MSQFIEMFGGRYAIAKWRDVLTITNGKAYKGEYQPEGKYPICGSGGLMGYGDEKLCKATTTILGRKGNINSPIYMDTEYWVVDTAFCIEVDKAILHPRYFHYWCVLFDFLQYNKQAVLPSLTKSGLLTIEISIPPMELQERFIFILEQADKSKFIGFKSQFIEMFRILHVDGTISDLTEGGATSVKKTYSNKDMIEYIDISSIDSASQTVLKTSKHIVGKAPLRAQQCVKNGDILVSTVRPVNRNIAVVDNDIPNLVASTGFCVLRPKEGYREYLLSVVTSDLYTEKMCDKTSGGLYPAVNNGDVLNYGIHIPDKGLANRVSMLYKQADKSKYIN